MPIRGYSGVSLETVGCSPGTAIPLWRASCNLDTDVSTLFPYINSIADDALYYEKPHSIQFTLDGIRCALYPDNLAAMPFKDRESIFSFFERLIGFLNDLEARKDSIEPNHEKYEPIPVFNIYKLLPRTNCKECGCPTCMAFAAALRNGEAALGQCSELNAGNENFTALKEMFPSK